MVFGGSIRFSTAAFRSGEYPTSSSYPAHLINRGKVEKRTTSLTQGAEREAAFTEPGKVWGVMRKAPKGGQLHPLDERANRIIAMVRAKVEHPFRVIKRQFGQVKTRYRGLVKNRAQLFTLFALGNLFLVRRKLMA
jgi:IS5 family transposase